MRPIVLLFSSTAWLAETSSFGLFSTSSSNPKNSPSFAKNNKSSPPLSVSSPVSALGWIHRGGGGGAHDNQSGDDRHTSLNAFVSDAVEVDYVSTENIELLSPRGRDALKRLIEFDVDRVQTHVYADWPEAGEEDEGKKQLCEQLADLDSSYPGGLASYLSKAKRLLRESAEGTNPFADYRASVPTGETLEYGTPAFLEAETVGLKNVAGAAFVLVAGGLGERLGYSGIKLSLETNLCNDECYLEVYARYILALQSRCEEGCKLPLVIMTSGDTDPATVQLLLENKNFGLDPDQVRIVCQDKVAALGDGNAALSMKGRWEIETKPHGHGDVHHLLHAHGIAEQWLAEGRTHVIFLQDTNALVINSILPTLGVSVTEGFDMNSICIPRLAGEAAGAIANLEHNTDPEKSLVINVEYNQLDALLSDTGGDVPDPNTGVSPYPGNANNLVFALEPYCKTLRGEDAGVVVEFVNPKYADDSRTTFKKPTRLECMMQDFPKLLQKELGSTNTRVGFTMFERWFTFSPAKNSLEAGRDAVAKGSTAPGTMSSAESDKYIQNQRKLRLTAGVQIPECDPVVVAGIPVTPGPRIILGASMALTQEELRARFRGDANTITARSSLVMEGKDIVIHNLQLDGALVIRAGTGCSVELDQTVISNRGWELVEVDDDDPSVEEVVAIRGYTMKKHETKEIILTEPGKYRVDQDGIVHKLE